MATVTRYPLIRFARHLRGSATTHVQHLAGGRPKHQGRGAAFWFRPLTAAVSEVPVDDREQAVLVRLRTRDLQEVSVPTTVTYRFADPALAASRVDFSVDLHTGQWLERPLEAVAAMIYGAVSAALTSALAGIELAGVLLADTAALAAQVQSAVTDDGRLGELGVEVVGVRFDLLRPDPDVERGLQTPARELIQQDADRATFERRARAVEREAAIGENELANQIELARRTQQLISQRGANSRREAEEAAAATAIETASTAERTTALALAQAAADTALGEAAAQAERARIAAYDNVSRDVMMTLVLRELAANLPSVDQLVLTPDLVTGLVGRLTAGGDAR